MNLFSVESNKIVEPDKIIHLCNKGIKLYKNKLHKWWWNEYKKYQNTFWYKIKRFFGLKTKTFEEYAKDSKGQFLVLFNAFEMTPTKYYYLMIDYYNNLKKIATICKKKSQYIILSSNDFQKLNKDFGNWYEHEKCF